MIRLEIAVDIAQRLMEAALIGPVGDIMHIQKDILPFMQNGGLFYILTKDRGYILIKDRMACRMKDGRPG